MRSRHSVDTSTRYDRLAELPPTREIEDVDVDVDRVAERDFPVTTVHREPYRASPELEDAVNLALALGRPLLLQGDPGAGKTRLAHAVAYALGRPLEQAHIKSTSRGQDLLYTYDAARRLYDVQMAGPDRRADRYDAHHYVRPGPLGRAIARAQHGRPSVVLIDEIDKADIDFPNDLLQELEGLAFTVAEAPDMRFAVPDEPLSLRPLIVITNNEEKTLPDAFLRRCIFHYVTFPSSSEDLDAILALHDVRQPELAKAAVGTLLQLRELDMAKKPGLSELLDWVNYLIAAGTPVDRVAEVPHAGALVKQYGDQQRVDRWLRQD